MADDRTTTSRPRRQVFIVSNPDDNDSGEEDASKSYEHRNPYSAALPSSTLSDRAPRPRPYGPPPLTTNLPHQSYNERRSNPALSSPSSTSSPAVESTPPPSTPGQSGLQLDITPDGNLRRDIASPPMNGHAPQPSWEQPPLRQGSSSKLPKLAMSPPTHYRNPSDHTRPLPSPTASESQSSNLNMQSRRDKVLVMVTTDSEQLFLVDISGAREPAFIREKIFSKLCIPDEDQVLYSIYRHEIGSYATGDALSDQQLFVLCRDRGDASGSLKFFVSHSSAPVHETPAIPRAPVHFPGHIPPVLPTSDNDSYCRPLQPKRQPSRRGSISSASERFPIREATSASGGYDASVSDDLDGDREANRLTIRPPPRQLPSTHAAQSGLSASPRTSPIPDSLRPHSPLTSLPPSLPPPRDGDTQPLMINKNRSPHTQPPYPLSPRGPDMPRDEGHGTHPNGGHARTHSDATSETLRPARSPPAVVDLSESPLQYQANPRDEKERSEQLRRRNVMVKPEWGQAARMQSVGSSETVDSKASGSQGDWVVVSSDVPQPKDLPTPLSAHDPGRHSPSFPRMPGRKKSASKNSPIRAAGFGGRLAIPNPPRNPPPTPPIPVSEMRSPRQPGQAISAAVAKRWQAAPPASKGDQKSLTPAKSMFDLRAVPPSLAPGKPANPRRPSGASRPSTGLREDNMAMLNNGFTRAKADINTHLYPRGAMQSSSSTARPGVRPLPGLGEMGGRGPLSGNGLSSAGSSYSQLSSLSHDAYASYQPTSADRAPSPTSARMRRPVNSPPAVPEGHGTLNSDINRSSPKNGSPRQPQGRPASREDETATLRTPPSTSSRTYLGSRPFNTSTNYSNSSASYSNSSTSLPRSPVAMRYPRSDSREAMNATQEQPVSSQPPRPSLPTKEDSGSFERTLKPEDHGWLIKALQESESGEATLMAPPKRVESKQLPPPPVPQPLPPPPPPPQPAYDFIGRTWRPPVDDDEDDEDEDTGTLWQERPKSVAQNKPAVPPIFTARDMLSPGHPPPSHPATTSPTRPPSHSSASPTEPFARGADYPRPPTEDVYERLDTFFPQHDLDKPLFDATSGGTSPTTVDIPAQHVLPAAPPSALPHLRYRNKKSIRHVAAEHKKRIDRTSRLQSTTAADVLRKRSTKLWGSKLEEVTSSQAQAIMANGPESPSAANPKPIFKWVRGELIGKGTYGRVYLALNATTGEMIAVKQVEIPRTASDREDFRQVSVVEALKSESETLKDLDHPHIVQYLGFEETPEFLSIFLEYVPGGSVGSCLRKHGKFSENVTKSFTEQILEGLEYLHFKGILHRDLKADNILVENTGICKISDFGISKRTDDRDQGAAFTAMQGTVFWMAPEVVKTNKKGYTFKIDIWSIGCIVLEMWAGRRPWNDEESVSVMYKLYHQDQIPPVPTGVELTQAADDFRRKCFAINPEERPSASELRHHPYLRLPNYWCFNGDFKNS